jgi:hypothetical protein
VILALSLASALMAMLLACTDDEIEEPRGLVSPVQGDVATTPWISVQFEILGSELQKQASMTLNEVDVTDPLGLTRLKSSNWGGMADYLANLDLRDLAPGEYTLSVTVGERTDSATFEFAPQVCRVNAQVFDETGDPLSARVIVFYEGHRLDLGNSSTAIDPRQRDWGVDAFYVLPDRPGTVFLPCRTYGFMAVQDPRREIDLQQATLVEGAPTELSFVLPVAVETPGEHSADLHMHSGRSRDGFLPDRMRVESIAASGLEVIVLTDHDHVFDMGPSFAAVLGERAPVLISGTESTVRLFEKGAGYHSTAHLNAFPLDPDTELPGRRGSTFAEMLAQFRSFPDWAVSPLGGRDAVLQLNHARGIQFREIEDVLELGWGLFNQLGYDHTVAPGEGANAWMSGCDPTTGVEALDFDVLEIMNRSSLSLYRELRSDWFSFLNHGVVFVGTGNSDSHGLVIEAPGFPLNLVNAPLPVDDESLTNWLSAVVQGQIRVTTGPIVGLIVDNGVATVRVQTASWVPVHQIRLVVNGREQVVVFDPVADNDGLFEALDISHDFELALTQDAWVVAEAGWPLGWERDPELLGLYADVAPEFLPIGFTNPIFLDVDGDGIWTPPGI